MEGMIGKGFTLEQFDAVKDVSKQLGVLWEKTATREREFRLKALKMFCANLASGTAAWKVKPEEQELGAHLLETPISKWLTLYMDDDGKEHVGIYSYPAGWGKGKEAKEAKEEADEGGEEDEDEMAALMREVMKK